MVSRSTPNAGGDQAQLTLAVAAWLDTCRTENTRAAYGGDLAHFAQWCGTRQLDPLAVVAVDLIRYRDACADQGAAPSTLNRRLSAIGSFGTFVANTVMSAGAAQSGGARTPVERPPVAAGSNAEILDDDAAAALLDAADATNPRAAVLVRLLMLDGLKVGEVVRADVADVKGRSPRMTLTLGEPAPRTIVLHTDTARAVQRYLARRRGGPLLLSEPRGREAGRLTRFGVDFLVKQTAQAAGLAQVVSGNTLRRRYVVAAHARGDDLDEIRRNAGHADERTTRRYLPPASAGAKEPATQPAPQRGRRTRGGPTRHGRITG